MLQLKQTALVNTAARRGAKGWSWVTARVTAQVLVLAAGLAIVFALASVFTEILDAVVDADDLTVIDRPTVQWLATHRTSMLTSVQVAITNLGGALVLAIVLAVTAVTAALRVKSWRPIGFAAVTIGGIQLLVYTIKVVIGRDRPGLDTRVVTADGFSFPSGHSASSLVGFALIAWLICMCTPRRTVWATAGIAALLLTIAVGVSRIYLGVHYPSDVLGGWTLGLTWLTAVAVAVRLRPSVTGSPRK
jgi:undecaprenyl-diphosphatase